MSRLKSKKHWECADKCYFKNDNYWGVVIQRLRCKDQSGENKFCFKFIRFMDTKDSNDYIHSDQHEIFWAYFKDSQWKLAGPIKIQNGEIINSKKAGAFDNPPAPLPVNEILVLPVRYRVLNF